MSERGRSKPIIIEEKTNEGAKVSSAKSKIVILSEEQKSEPSQTASMIIQKGIVDQSANQLANPDNTQKNKSPSKSEDGMWWDGTIETEYNKTRSKYEPVPIDSSSKTENNKKYQVVRANGTLVYEGCLGKQMKKSGQGRLYYPNGDIYEGRFQNDKRDGDGQLYFNSGERYEGEFKNDNMEGFGTRYDKNGLEIYYGEFKKNLKDGNGRLRLDGDNWYIGQFSNDFRHGFGTLFLKNDCAYAGNWDSNRKHGEFKKYSEWDYDKNDKKIPQIAPNCDYEIVYFRQDVPTATKPTRAKIQIILNDGTKKNAEVSQALVIKPIKEIVSRFGIRITTEDMQTLEGSNPLGANIMNFYMKAIEAKYLENCHGNTEIILPHKNPHKKIFLFLDSDFFSELTADNLDSIDINYEKVKHRFKAYSNPQHTIFDDFNRILMIINKKGAHWLLAEIYCKHVDRKVTSLSFNIYDSMMNPPVTKDPKEYTITRHLVNFALSEVKARLKETSEEYKNLMKLINEAELAFIKVPQQKDLHNCGVFVSRYIQHFAAGKTVIDFPVEKMNDFRKEIESVILGTCVDPLIIDRLDS